jgi:hypothetical protein
MTGKERHKRACEALLEVMKSFVEESPDDLEFLDEQIAAFNQYIVDGDDAEARKAA